MENTKTAQTVYLNKKPHGIWTLHNNTYCLSVFPISQLFLVIACYYCIVDCWFYILLPCDWNHDMIQHVPCWNYNKLAMIYTLHGPVNSVARVHCMLATVELHVCERAFLSADLCSVTRWRVILLISQQRLLDNCDKTSSVKLKCIESVPVTNHVQAEFSGAGIHGESIFARTKQVMPRFLPKCAWKWSLHCLDTPNRSSLFATSEVFCSFTKPNKHHQNIDFGLRAPRLNF